MPAASGIQQNLDRYERLIGRYAVGIHWLERQLARGDTGSAVDSELATYDRGDYAVLHEATRKQIQELVDIIGQRRDSARSHSLGGRSVLNQNAKET